MILYLRLFLHLHLYQDHPYLPSHKAASWRMNFAAVGRQCRVRRQARPPAPRMRRAPSTVRDSYRPPVTLTVTGGSPPFDIDVNVH
jgi:hypothetical protein